METVASAESGTWLEIPIDHYNHVPPSSDELHHLPARSRQLRPLRPGVRVLTQPPNRVPLENEMHVPQAAFRSAPDGIAASVQFDDRGVLDESLTPDLDERLLSAILSIAWPT